MDKPLSLIESLMSRKANEFSEKFPRCILEPNSIIALLFIQNIFKLLKQKMSCTFNNFAHSNHTISCPFFFGQRFNNLQRAAFLTSSVQ